MFDELLEALRSTGIPFAAYAWNVAPQAPYGIVSLEGAGYSVGADDEIAHLALRGTIDLFLNGPDVTPASDVMQILNGLVAWRLNTVQFEEDTRLVHWEWFFEYAQN